MTISCWPQFDRTNANHPMSLAQLQAVNKIFPSSLSLLGPFATFRFSVISHSLHRLFELDKMIELIHEFEQMVLTPFVEVLDHVLRFLCSDQRHATS